MRFYRVADFDLEAALPPIEQSDRLREAVDELPALERHVIERCFFGGATLLQAAKEVGLGQKRCRELRQSGIERLRAAMFPDDELGPVPAAGGPDVGDGSVHLSRDLGEQGPDTGPLLRGEDREGLDGPHVQVPERC